MVEMILITVAMEIDMHNNEVAAVMAILRRNLIPPLIIDHHLQETRQLLVKQSCQGMVEEGEHGVVVVEGNEVEGELLVGHQGGTRE